ncbi:energy transducer TonB [Arsukibacterium ikkense]|uniref:Energy transducer TonB n=1 Tax=Arsukibacterium ikkense TaxID=336831 RepID=A0A0M2V165_9GAMM|nr:energy transducer TonB [Arsukibacterium ikkense]KKO44366.1 energy transducer TonB [Arsukibacterium ikkense]
MKLPIIIVVALATAVFRADAVGYADVHITYMQPAAGDAIWSREKQVTPRYPLELAQQGIIGCGVFNVTINEKGKTTDVSLVSSVPDKVIARPASKVIKSWKWVNSSELANAPEQKLIRLDFCMGGSSMEEAQARCQVQATAACQG